jgi:Concanavalin A-like lectin/glucanases superfamily
VAALTACLVGVLALPATASASVWHLDERSGTTAVDSGGSNNGTLKNVQVGQLPAFSGTAYRFNGVNSIVTVPASTTLNYSPTSAQFTLTVHVAFTVVPSVAVGDYDLIRKGLSSTAGGYYKLEIFPSSDHTQGRALCQLRGAKGTAKLVGGPNLATGTMHTIRCVVRPTSVSLVVDGATVLTKAATIGAITNSSRLTMGAKSSGGDWFKGLLDEVSVLA